MTQLAPQAVKGNPQDPTPSSTESTEEQTQETEETSEQESEQTKEQEEEQEVKPGQKAPSTKYVPIERFNEIYGQMRRLDRLAMQLLEERKTQQRTPVKEEPELDYDTMTPKQLVQTMRKQSREDIQELLNQTLTPLRQQNETQVAKDSIAKAAAKFPDYWDHKEDMIEYAEKHPDLDAEEVYLLVTGRKGPAADKIMTEVKQKVDQKRDALTTKRSSPTTKTDQPQKFKNIREGALAAAKAAGLINE